jgi:hypothetical protein
MDNRLIKLLDSPIPADRIKAVKEMAKSGDAGYLPYLSALYKTEQDESVREAVVQAGRYLKRKNTEDEWQGTGTRAPERAEPQRVEVSPANERKASEMLDRALNLHLQRNVEEAQELVAKAYALDPNIRLDSYKGGIVSQVMEMPVQDAFQLLEDGPTKVPGGKPKAKVQATQQPVSWGTALFDLLIYGLLVGAALIISGIIIIQVLQPLVFDMISDPALYTDSNFSMASVLEGVNALFSAGIGLLIMYGVVAGFMSIIMFMVSAVALHLSARLLGGKGYLTNLIHRLAPFYGVVTVLSMVIGVITFVLTIQTLSQVDWSAVTTETYSVGGTTYEYTTGPNIPYNPIADLLQAISTLLGLGSFLYASHIVAQVYNFSWLRGCSAQVFASVILMLAACGFVFLSATAIGAGISSALIPFITSVP